MIQKRFTITCTIPGLLCTACGALIQYHEIAIYPMLCPQCNSRRKRVSLPIDYFTETERIKFLSKEEIVELLI